MMLEARNLTIRIEGDAIFKDVNLCVGAGQIAVISSHFGDGATSFLRSLTGIMDDVEGEVLLQGINLLSLEENRLLDMRSRIGFVHERRGLISNMDVFRNIALPLRYHHNLSSRALVNRVLEVSVELGISHLLEREPNQLNEAQTWTVNLARSLAQQPKLLLIDRFGSRKSKSRQMHLLEVIQKYQSVQGFATVMVTLNPDPDYGDQRYTIAEHNLLPNEVLADSA